MRSFVAAALALGCVLASPLASAQFVSLLKGGPAEFFDDADRQLFLDTLHKALDEAPDNQALAWRNPKTQHHGDITVLKRFESKGRACKEVRVRNEARGRKSDMRHNVCNVDGRWRLVGESQL
jgi:surface antigen